VWFLCSAAQIELMPAVCTMSLHHALVLLRMGTVLRQHQSCASGGECRAPFRKQQDARADSVSTFSEERSIGLRPCMCASRSERKGGRHITRFFEISFEHNCSDHA